MLLIVSFVAVYQVRSTIIVDKTCYVYILYQVYINTSGNTSFKYNGQIPLLLSPTCTKWCKALSVQCDGGLLSDTGHKVLWP